MWCGYLASYSEEYRAILPVACAQISLLIDEVDRVKSNVVHRLSRIENVDGSTFSDSLKEYLENERRNLESLKEELEFIQRVISNVSSSICQSNAHFSDMLRAIETVEKLYFRYVFGPRKIPGHILPLLYQVNFTLQSLTKNM